MEFEYNLMDNILNLHDDLKKKHINMVIIRHSKSMIQNQETYTRRVSGDRVLHHAVYKVLYPEYDKTFISDSYSECKQRTHKAIYRFENYTRKVSQNYNKQCWILKCDIRKFFASIGSKYIIKILEQKILDRDILNLTSKT